MSRRTSYEAGRKVSPSDPRSPYTDATSSMTPMTQTPAIAGPIGVILSAAVFLSSNPEMRPGGVGLTFYESAR